MKNNTPSYCSYWFPSAVISYSIWFYHLFGLSFREVADFLSERGITITYETIR